MTELSFHEQLSRPFTVGELKFFPVALSQDKKSAKVGAYIDARTVEDRLDEAVGPGQWATTYRCIDPSDKAVECTLSLHMEEGAWVGKADVGYPNEARDADNASKEPWKAAYSDALKRAAVQWGIGRYIYGLKLERDWLPVDERGRFTEQPRLKGDTRQGADVRNTPTTATSEPASGTSQPSPAASPPKRMWYDVTREMGFEDEEVIAVSQQLFDNREPRQLSVEEKRRLVLAMEERLLAKETEEALI